MRRRRSILGLFAAVLLTAAGPPLLAEEPPQRPPAMAIGLIRDLRLTVLAERAFRADRVLAPLNLRVKVRSGVADLSGTIPSEETGRLAVAKLETIQGINEVRTSFKYQEGATAALPPAKPPEERTVTESAKPLRLPDPETPRNRPGGPAIVTGGEGRKARPENPRQMPLVESTPVPNYDKESRVAFEAPRKAARSTETSNAQSARPLSLADRVEQARRSQQRFAAIAVEIQDDTLIVKRSGVRSEDATALSQVLRRIPGVSAVVLSSD